MIIKNATIIAGTELLPMEGYIKVKDGRIKEIGSGGCHNKNAVDAKRGIVFPSFTNAHVHLMDSIAPDAGAYEKIGRRVGKGGIKFQILEEKRKDIPAGIGASLKEMTASGTTAFCDFREGGLNGVKIKPRIKAGPSGIILGRPGGGDISSVLDKCDGIGVSSVADYSKNELKDIKNATRKKKKILAVHTAEVKDDVKAALKLGPDFLVHMTNAKSASLEAVFKKKTPVVICPRANAMLGVGLPKIKELLENTTVAIGTDNVMINSLDMFREVEFTFKAARALAKDHGLDARAVLGAATINGRKVLGLENNSITEGNVADFVIVKRKKYLYDPVLAIMHRLASGDIKGTVVGRSVCIKKS
ncbi:amidohydrolase family protein [archaeon]|nr:amidohydrolase family protein [archaeon]